MSDEPRPTLRIIRGNATAEEIAALLAVVTARSVAVAEAKRPTAAWSDRAALLRRPPWPGRGAWRASAGSR
jgi:hypothetical protein